jgi:hypothetical protein
MDITTEKTTSPQGSSVLRKRRFSDHNRRIEQTTTIVSGHLTIPKDKEKA